jgi:hypothetical protein
MRHTTNKLRQPAHVNMQTAQERIQVSSMQMQGIHDPGKLAQRALEGIKLPSIWGLWRTATPMDM